MHNSTNINSSQPRPTHYDVTLHYKLSMPQLSMAQLGMTKLSMTQLDMTQLSMTQLSMP